jgi:hypothetical protein
LILKKHFLAISFFLFLSVPFAKAQLGGGNVSGNFQIDAQYYNTDSLINALPVPEKILSNGFANVNYTNGVFSAGLRYESYLNALQGFDPRWSGSGLMYRYASYIKDELEVTVGSFYEQFGSGLILRSYEARGLGIDNAFDGIRVKYKIGSGIYTKGFVARQRSFFDFGPGIVRGADAEIMVNETFESLSESKTRWILGGSVVSKYQKDEDPIAKLPENVAAFSGRMNVIRGKVNVGLEYAYKINDPSAVNDQIYKNGEALTLNTSYSKKGLGINLGLKRIDNMDFRSDRTQTGNVLNLNYLPAFTRQHTYSLVAFYPYATQPNGELGAQAEIIYNIKSGSKLGGKYGTKVNIGFSHAQSLDTVQTNDGKGYTSDFFAIGDEVYFQDFNIEISKKINKSWKLNLMHAAITYNKGVIEKPGEPVVYAQVSVIDISHKLSDKHNIRAEFQHLLAEQDKGSWAMALLEYSVAPSWYVSVFDEYNYGNDEAKKRLHYFTGQVVYVKNANRISLGYGRQREGIFCVGGVCRTVPASNGIALSITSSF